MATEVEILGRREVPGLNPANPKELYVVVFWRPVGDAGRGDSVTLPAIGVTDEKIAAAIRAKMTANSAPSPRRLQV